MSTATTPSPQSSHLRTAESSPAPKPIPGPKGSWLLGNATEFQAGVLEFYERLHREYGPVAQFRLGRHRLILASDPELLEEVLVTKNKTFKKHFITQLLKPILGNGLLLSEGKEWLAQRKLIQPAFSRRFTNSFAAIAARAAMDIADKWRAKGKRDLYQDMTQLTVHVAAAGFLGIEDTAVAQDIGESIEAIHADFEVRFRRAFHLPDWLPTPANRRRAAAIAQLRGVVERMIATRRQQAEAATATTSIPNRDALSLMLTAKNEAGQGMPENLLRDEVMTLLLAGHDTTANALTWTWTLLEGRPEVAQQICDEGRKCFASWDPMQGELDLTALPFTVMVVKESMRLRPPAYMFGRQATERVRLGDYEVQAGDSIKMAPWVIHRDERFYEAPLEFRPERWTEAFERDLPKFAYCPFGGGPRICIGKEVAMAEAVVALAVLLSQFDVRLTNADEITPRPTATLCLNGPVNANVTLRQH